MLISRTHPIRCDPSLGSVPAQVSFNTGQSISFKTYHQQHNKNRQHLTHPRMRCPWPESRQKTTLNLFQEEMKLLAPTCQERTPRRDEGPIKPCPEGKLSLAKRKISSKYRAHRRKTTEEERSSSADVCVGLSTWKVNSDEGDNLP